MIVRRVLTIMLGLILLTATATAVAAKTEPGHDDSRNPGSEIRAPDEHGAEPFARLQIGKSSELIFYETSTERGVSSGIGISRYVPAGGMDPTTVRELHGANPHEIFYALSRRGTQVPGILREYHHNRFERLGQGWGLGKIKPGVYNLFSCEISGQAVANAVAGTGLPYSYNELSQGPHNGPFWHPEDPNALFPTYYKNNGFGTMGDAYFHVMLCEEDPMFDQTSVNVRLTYEETNAPYGYGEVIGQGEINWQLDTPGDQMSFMSWPFDSDLAGDNTWFWMLTISGVHYHDTLHVGTAWS